MDHPCRDQLLAWAAVALLASAGWAEDWEQLQHDPARTGRTPDSVRPPFRARWIWMGRDHVLRNRHSGDGGKWSDDLTSRDGYTYPMPENVPFSFSGAMQPVTGDGACYVADLQGSAYAIELDDGATRWQSPLPGGAYSSGVVADRTAVFASLTGHVVAFDTRTGRRRWSVDLGRSVTGAPALADGTVYVGDHGGRLHALRLADGNEQWTSEDLGGPIVGGLCVHDGGVYVGVETLHAVRLDATTGRVAARRKLPGQSFRMTWPVAVGRRVIFTTGSAVCVGSEYVNDPVLAGRPNEEFGWVQGGLEPGYPTITAEQQALRRWIADEGHWWETCHALDADTLAKDYIVATGATEGCGAPPEPPVIGPQGRPIVWWSTAHATLMRNNSFGTNFTNDAGPFDLDTGLRIPIDNGRLAGQTLETDNLYAMTIGGRTLYLRQSFRGTSCVDLDTSSGARISAAYRYRDGGGWISPVNYASGQRQGNPRRWPDSVPRVPRTPSATRGRVGPTITGSKLLFTETFGVTCVERDD